MNKITKNLIIVLAIVFLALLSYVIFSALQLRKDISQLKEFQKSNFIIREKLARTNDVSDKLEKVKEVINSFDEFYIDRENIITFIELIERMAEAKGVTLIISSVNLDESHLSEPLPYGLVSMNLSVSGKFGAVGSFVESMESLPHQIDFDAVRMVQNNAEENLWTATMAINGITN